MEIKEYDTVLLKNGEKAQIVEILKEGAAFIADIEKDGDYDNDIITIDDISKVL